MMYKKVSIEEELPPLDVFVTCFYGSGETMVYKRFETGTTKMYGNTPVDTTINAIEKDWAWTMRDGIADRTPKEGKITHWLKEVEEIEDSIPYPIETLSLQDEYSDIVVLVSGCAITMSKAIIKEMIGQYIYKTKTS